mgnify:CR=1 FL=1
MVCAVTQLEKHYSWYKLDTLMASARFLNACMDSENYGTDRVRFACALHGIRLKPTERCLVASCRDNS